MSRVGIEKESPIGKLVEIRNSLVGSFVQRETEVTACLSALLSGEPAILIGPPGTAKTMLIETMSKMINARYFYYLLTRFTEPDELIGPLDVKALRNGEYRRIVTHRLPEAEIVFLDEIFKSSSAVRNILLDIILNKRILNGTHYIRLPMIAFYSASNEVSTDAEDQAFYDRLTIRSFHGYVTEDSWEDLLDAGLQLIENKNSVEPLLTVESIRELQRIVLLRASALRTRTDIKRKFIEALGLLKQKGIEISDRRKIKCLIVTSAISVLYLEKSVSLDSLAEALRFCAVHEPEDLGKVEEVIMEAKLSTVAEHIQRLQAMSTELENVMQLLRSSPSIDNLKALNTVKNKILVELKRMPKNPRLLPYVRRLLPRINEAVNLLKKYQEELFGGENANAK